jgi:hypothetical protein
VTGDEVLAAIDSRVAHSLELAAKVKQSGTVATPPAASGSVVGAPAQPDSSTAQAPGESGLATQRAPGAQVEGDPVTANLASEIAALEIEVARRGVGALALEGTADAVLAMVKGGGHKLEVKDETEIVFADGRRLPLSREALAAAGVPAQLIRAAGVGGSGSQTSGNLAASEPNPLSSQKAWDAMPRSKREAYLKGLK